VAITLLLVDDEPKVIDFMKPFLEREGFRILIAGSGMEALEFVRTETVELVVLDWMLPGMNGLDVCQEIRKMSKAGIIMVTARSEEADKVIGLEVGADDYLTKPFSLRELTARIRSVLRRLGNEPEDPGLLTRGALVIDEAKFRVWNDGEEVVLTPTEFKILITLANRPGVVYTRLQLLKEAMGEQYFNYERTIDTHVSHLRQKIERDPSEPVYIQTVYGMGYRFGDQT
jgi:DNA-binding response OmpR family regulator